MSYYRDQLEEWLKTIDVTADRVFDIGGAARPVRERVKTWHVGSCLILDNGAEGVEGNAYLDLNLPQGEFARGNVIFCLEVFEYIYRPLEALDFIWALLDEGGVAYLSFPFFYPLHEPKERDCLRYTRIGVETLLKLAGFSKWGIEARVDRSGKLEEFFRADGMHPAKAEAHNCTGWLVKAWK